MKKINLTMQIFIGLALGIIIGALFYGNSGVEVYLKPIGDIFIRLIKMIVVPIVISTLIIGVAGVGDIKKLGKLGGKSIVYFEIVTTIAILFGLLVANLVRPGDGVDMSHLVRVISIATWRRLKSQATALWIRLSILFLLIFFKRWAKGICWLLSFSPSCSD